MSTWLGALRLRWKILLAPAFLVLVLVGLGTYTLQTLRANQAAADRLISGPVRQAEVIAALNESVLLAQVRLYSLTATAANETDQSKIKGMAERTAAALARIPDKLKRLESTGTNTAVTDGAVGQLKTVVTTYLRQAKNAVEMADGDAASALMFVVNAERSYLQLEKLVEELAANGNKLRDHEISAANARLDEQVMLFAAVGLAAIALGCLVAFLVSGGIARPVVKIATIIERIAEGKIDEEIPATAQRDEIGAIARAVRVFKDKLIENERLRSERAEAEKDAVSRRAAEMQRLADQFEASVGNIVAAVAGASVELEAAARTLTETAESTQQLSSAVTASSEEASTNVQSVASAAEEMASSVDEIARQVQESSRIANEAVAQAEKTDARINELSGAASRIGDVVRLITAIAEQTNLLALNATIEAARAGDAGRGFAVVAQEVKALASQTAKATDEIGTQIGAMQTATKESVAAIHEIGHTIGRIAHIAASVTVAVEEQGAATQEIARNVHQAATGTTAVVANITDVNRGASQTGSASSRVLSAAQALSTQSNELKLELGKFLATVRAA
jgi:methyl-accepting chemotaxis protein